MLGSILGPLFVETPIRQTLWSHHASAQPLRGAKLSHCGAPSSATAGR